MSCKDKTLKIYLIGKMSGLTFKQMNDCRVALTNKLNLAAENAGYNIVVINPVIYFNFEEKKYQSEKEIEEFDLFHATTSDIAIVNLEGLESSDGSKYEMHDCAYHKKIPVIAFGNRVFYEILHPWTKHDITRVEPNMEDVVDYIKDFYMIWLMLDKWGTHEREG